MAEQIHKIETSILKSVNRADINRRMEEAADEENRLMALLTEEDSGTTPELQAVQQLRQELFDEAFAIMEHYDEITYFRGSSFIDKFFNQNEISGFEFEITQEQIAQFISECNLVLENPEVGESVLPIIPACETPKYAEDDEYHEEPIYYDEDYINNVRHAKEVFTDVLNNTDWTKDMIFLHSVY